MKKLDLKQMEKINGGHSAARCARIARRAMSNAKRGNGEKMNDLRDKYMSNC